MEGGSEKTEEMGLKKMEPDQPPLEFEIKKQLLGEDIRANFQMKPRAVSFIFSIPNMAVS